MLLGGLAGCQNPLRNEEMKGLEARYKSLANQMDMDRSAPIQPQNLVKEEAQNGPSGEVRQASFAQTDKESKKKHLILDIPKELPGAGEYPFKFKDPEDYKKNYKQRLKEIYPPLGPLEGELALAPGPEGHPLSLADLQQLGNRYSPAIRAAEHAVVAAQGGVRQALTHPNPTFAYEGDTVATLPAGYQGFYIDQLIKTGNKLQLQGAAAKIDVFNAQLALRRARYDLAYQVRNGYFSVLVAQENVKLSRAFAKFTEEIYTKQVKMMKGNIAAAYEPMQLRPLALQARLNLIQAVNQYRASWRQLVANMGLPDMPPTELAGRVDQAVPEFGYDDVLQRMLTQHTDVLTAQNNIRKAQYVLKLAQAMPIPDVGVHVLVQKDYTTPPFLIAPSVGLSVPLPLWDRNLGNIQAAQAMLKQALQLLPQARNGLIVTLADAFNRYLTARKQVEYALRQVTDQIHVYRGVYNRHFALPEDLPGPGGTGATFADVVTAQQTLAGYLTAYITALGLQWTAVVDVANLLQVDDMFKQSKKEGAPNLDHEESPLDQVRAMLQGPPATEPATKSNKVPAAANASPPPSSAGSPPANRPANGREVRQNDEQVGMMQTEPLPAKWPTDPSPSVHATLGMPLDLPAEPEAPGLEAGQSPAAVGPRSVREDFP
jgi:cobalt-zinc-cadmium efflux system outer membrane protein